MPAGAGSQNISGVGGAVGDEEVSRDVILDGTAGHTSSFRTMAIRHDKQQQLHLPALQRPSITTVQERRARTGTTEAEERGCRGLLTGGVQGVWREKGSPEA